MTNSHSIPPRRPGDKIHTYEVLEQLSRPVDAGQSQVYLVRRKASSQPPLAEVVRMIKSGNLTSEYIDQQQMCVLKIATPGWEDNLRVEHGYLLRIESGQTRLVQLSSGFGPTGGTPRPGPKGFGWADLQDERGTRITLPFLLTTFYSGGSLLHLLNREQRRPLPTHFALEVTLQLAEALRCLREFDLVHHDISPHNVVFRSPIRSLNDTPDCVLIDFAAAEAPSERRPTRQAGKPHYLPPQRLARTNPMEPSWQIDLYGLGIVLYEMLVGDLPRRTDVRTGLPKPLPAITEHRQDLSTELVALLTDTVNHDPRRWPMSLDAFTDRLRATPEFQPTPPPPARELRKVWFAVSGVAGALLLGGAILFGNANGAPTPMLSTPTINIDSTVTPLPPTPTPSPTSRSLPTSTPNRVP